MTSTTRSAASVNRIVLNDGSTFAFRNPYAATDSTGSVHIVAQGQLNDFSTDDDVYYYRVAKNGAVMTPQFAVTTGGVGVGRTKVVATSTGNAVVAWKEGAAIMAVLIDPSGGGSILDGPITVKLPRSPWGKLKSEGPAAVVSSNVTASPQ